MQLLIKKVYTMHGVPFKTKFIDQTFGLMFSGFKNVLDVGHTVCIRMPKRAVVVCFIIQKELILLPFRWANKVYEAFLKPPLKYLLRVYQKENPTAVELLTGEKNPSSDQIINAAKELRCAVFKSINKDNNIRSQVLAYKDQLDKWKLENEKRTEEIYKISLEEKELMKAIASALRYVRSLKAKREKMDESFCKGLDANVESVSAEKLVALMRQIKNVDTAINEKKKDCLNLLNQGRIVEMDLPTEIKKKKINKEKQKSMDNIHTLSPSESVQKIFSVIVDENMHLKTRLASTHKKLEDILNLSENINKEIINLGQTFAKVVSANNEMSTLQEKLDKERDMLKAVEADRDQMKQKLEVLEFMIKEEEAFLGEIFENPCDDEPDSTSVLSLVSQLEV